jgi:hypothetical protein
MELYYKAKTLSDTNIKEFSFFFFSSFFLPFYLSLSRSLSQVVQLAVLQKEVLSTTVPTITYVFFPPPINQK